MVSIKDILSKEVATITKDQSVYKAAKKMIKKGMDCLVIVEKGIVKGTLTRKDIIEKIVVNKKDPEKIKVEEIMSSPAKTVTPEANFVYTSTIMAVNKIKQIPVVNDKDGKLVGIVTQIDLIKNINKVLSFDFSGNHR